MSFKDKSLILKIGNQEIDIVKNRWIEVGALIAIATNKSSWDDINEQYKEVEKEAILVYSKSTFYEMPILQTLTVPIRAMTIKAISLYVYNEERDNASLWITEMANRGYKRYIDFVKNNIRAFSWESFFVYQRNRNPEMSAADHDHLMLLIFVVFGENIFPSIKTDYGRNMIHNMYQENEVTAVMDKKFHELKEKEKMNALRRLNNTIHVKIPNEKSIDWFFQEHESYLITNLLTESEKRTIRHKNDYNPLYNKGLLRYYKPLTGILREHKLNDFNYTSKAFITRDDFTGIYVMFQQGVEMGRLKEEEWELFLISSMLLLMMVKHYKELSDFYFDTVKKQEEIVLKEQTLSSEQESWNSEKREILKQEKEWERKLELKDAYIQELEEKVKELENQKEESLYLKKEVSSLRNYAYNHRAEVSEQEETVDIVAHVTTLLATKKAVLFGGHPQLINKLKETLPNMEYRDVDSINRDISFISNKDIVFLLTNYFNHPFYYKLMNELEKHPNVKLIYLSGYPNLERTLGEMADLIKA